MSQESLSLNTSTALGRQRRARQRRNRPILVTNAEQENSQLQADESSLHEEDSNIATAEASSTAPSRSAIRFPKFFSRVDKSEESEDTGESGDIVKASRLARIKASAARANGKERAKSGEKAKIEPLFKMRHFIGFFIYLAGAQFILPFELSLTNQLGLDRAFPTRFLGVTIPALILNVSTLILFLYLLVKWDFLPNTASARKRAEQKAKERQKNQSANEAPAAAKRTPPSVRQGVKGKDDDLYLAYRAQQHRQKNR